MQTRPSPVEEPLHDAVPRGLECLHERVSDREHPLEEARPRLLMRGDAEDATQGLFGTRRGAVRERHVVQTHDAPASFTRRPGRAHPLTAPSSAGPTRAAF